MRMLMGSARRARWLALPLVAGCYTYEPIREATVAPGTDVRAHVTVDASTRVAPLLGVTEARDLSGTVVSNTDGSLVIEVPTIVQSGVNRATQTLFQRIAVSPADVLELQTRRLSNLRTGLAVGAATVLAGVVIAHQFTKSGGTDSPPGGDPGTEARIPVLRFHF
jgi:hypothetical protein